MTEQTFDKNKKLKERWIKHIMKCLKDKNYEAVLYGLSCNIGDKGDIKKFVEWVAGEMDPDEKLLKENLH